jgi:bifunctional non-homologous end joining protein LigD
MTSHRVIPEGHDTADVRIGSRTVRLTNLQKIFWPELGLTKGDLLSYYATVAPVLLPHLRARAMVMKRYPHGAAGPFFFMKRTPAPHPAWLRTCSIRHKSSNVIDFPVIDDRASLLWLVNLGCIDLNQWYSRCDDVNRPDYLHFDLDPVGDLPLAPVLEAALLVRDRLTALGLPSFPKTSGASGMHIYVPIARGPMQKDVWRFAKQFAQAIAAQHSKQLTAEYLIRKRPAGRVLVDYNQNAWGRTLASVYSVRPTPHATVSAPVTWQEVERGLSVRDFSIVTMAARIRREGDLFKPVAARTGRVKLERWL